VHVVRQDDPPVDTKWRLPAYLPYRLAQRLDVRDEQIGTTVEQVHRKEVRGARDPVAAVIRHARSMPEIGLRRNALLIGGMRFAFPPYGAVARACRIGIVMRKGAGHHPARRPLPVKAGAGRTGE
jgi:hypothetical protein